MQATSNEKYIIAKLSRELQQSKYREIEIYVQANPPFEFTRSSRIA